MTVTGRKRAKMMFVNSHVSWLPIAGTRRRQAHGSETPNMITLW